MYQAEVGNKWINAKVVLATWQQAASCILSSHKVRGINLYVPALLEPAEARRLRGDVVSCQDEAGTLSQLNPLSLAVQWEWH